MLSASGPDLLRLVAIPGILWAAWSDYQVRRVDRRLWVLLILLGTVATIWQILSLAPLSSSVEQEILERLVWTPVVSGVIAALLTQQRVIGGADAKALFTLALLFPATHLYSVPGLSVPLPIATGRYEILFVSIITNSFIFGFYYVLSLWAENFLAGERDPSALSTKRYAIEDLDRAVGQLRVTSQEAERDGEQGVTTSSVILDADTLRMYLRWRGESLDSLQASDSLRDPKTITTTYQVGTGAIPPRPNRIKWLPLPEGTDVEQRPVISTDGGSSDDPWGAERFFDEIDHYGYGDRPQTLRAGLEYITSHESVRVQPAFPLLVPLLFGLLTALTAGSLLELWVLILT